jgi:hypothetical protein
LVSKARDCSYTSATGASATASATTASEAATTTVDMHQLGGCQGLEDSWV